MSVAMVEEFYIVYSVLCMLVLPREISVLILLRKHFVLRAFCANASRFFGFNRGAALSDHATGLQFFYGLLLYMVVLHVVLVQSPVGEVGS